MAQIRSFFIWEIRVIRGQKHGDEKVEKWSKVVQNSVILKREARFCFPELRGNR